MASNGGIFVRIAEAARRHIAIIILFVALIVSAGVIYILFPDEPSIFAFLALAGVTGFIEFSHRPGGGKEE